MAGGFTVYKNLIFLNLYEVWNWKRGEFLCGDSVENMF